MLTGGDSSGNPIIKNYTTTAGWFCENQHPPQLWCPIFLHPTHLQMGTTLPAPGVYSVLHTIEIL
ncbi:hypothetical protein A19Y_4643 [Planktothrix agardhii NIVA-CYA 126/8]|uniref:Uncharacterized protein n=1 Tax=Planktothrix agardhii (strain NIVA-CYA 126/8) TaxID=388467 RepID=A0A073CNE1_PLAA1|nr:hypothetical protein A19Y_4643 [Planktothrix agardhii NIVA-CYA 126/8]